MSSSFVSFQEDSPQIRESLLRANSSSEALRNLYKAHKQIDAKYSLPFICRRAGISSTGYLADVISGRRTLHLKYQSTIGKAFALKGAAARYLKLLIAVDNERDEAKLRSLRTRQQVLRKAMNVTVTSFDAVDGTTKTQSASDLFLALTVFCAFGLFRNNPTTDQLVQHFGSRPDAAHDVSAALALLRSMGLVEKAHDDSWILVSQRIIFKEGQEGLSHTDFLRMALSHAMANLPQWLPRNQESHIESSIISVKSENYRRTIAHLKDGLALMRSDLEEGDADMLVHFNIQIYPLTQKPATPPRT